MKLLRDLVEKEDLIPNKFLTTEVKNYELFSESELKSYFNSEKFQNDLKECEANFCFAEDERLLQFFVLRRTVEKITLVVNTLNISD